MDKQQQQEWDKLTRQRWWVLIASCLINLCIGSLYTWSVFSAPMAEHLNALNGTALTSGSLAIVFTVANSVGPITLISGGFFNDRMGPRWVIFLGGLIFGGGMLLCGFATSVPMLIVGFGLCCGLAMGLVYGCTVSNSVKFFPDHRGLIGGLATATYGIGSVIIPPIATALISSVGVTGAFQVFGVVFLIAICGGSFLVRRCPEGFVPTGWTPPAQAASSGSSGGVDMDWKGMLSSPVFYVMIFMLTCGAFSGLMIISQTSNIAQSMAGMTASAAAVAVSVLALFNGAGRVLAGWLSDKLGRIRTLQAVFVLYILGLALLLVTKPGAVAVFYGGVGLVGLCFGSFMGIFPGFTADQFGVKHNSVNYGIMFIGFALAGFFGPMGMNALYQMSGSYTPSFLLGMVLSVVGLALTFAYQAVSKKM
jgi:MFS family permease